MRSKSRTIIGALAENDGVLSPVQQPRSPTAKSGIVCPDCDRVIPAVDTSEAVCSECGIVLDENPISTKPRPRYDDGRSRRRAGGRVTNLYADRGIGVGVADTATDSKGNCLSRSQRRVARDKPWTKHRSPEEFRLDYALGELRRMGAVLDVPDAERERAARLYRRAHAADAIVGRSTEGFATACLLVALRQSSVSFPISTAELEEVTRATDEQIRTARGALEVELGVEVPPMKPHEFLPKFTSELGTSDRVRRCAETLLEEWEASQDEAFRSISPRTLAAAALHTAYDVVNCRDRPTLSQLSAVADVAESTISQRKECFEHHLEGR